MLEIPAGIGCRGKTPREASENSAIEAKCTPSHPQRTGSSTVVAAMDLNSGW
jgi:hypothetical protein